MIMLTTFIFAFLCIVALTAVVHAQSQSGFISIDCGIPENASYSDKITGINYVSDATYVDTGVSHSISSGYNNGTVERQFLNLRSFPEGIRNCYTLRPANGDVKFLIRASFMYGNYDGQDIPPGFDLMLGADVWDSVQLQDSDGIITKEIIHMPNKGYIHVCLVNTYSGTPFISTLELRPLNNSIYKTQSGSLSRYFRWDVGSTTNETFRYPDDVYDRIWSPGSIYDRAPISTSSNVDSTGTINFNLPSTVMQTAVIPANGGTSLKFHWVPVNRTFKYYVYMHFSEVGSDLAKNQTREMYIYLNGEEWYGPLSPPHLETVTVFSTSPMTNDRRYDMEIRSTDNSSLPPILNALEVYQVKEFLQLLTQQQDVDAITNIKSKYDVKKDWQGDPCTPRLHLWQGLNCSYDDYQPPRIISLNLSSSGITGEIDPYIFSLTSIESLDLSNNSLTGLVPDFLAELESLTVLNLSGNNLQGSLPAGLVEKANNRSLSLSVERNPNLCLSDSCKKKNNRFIVPGLASVVTFSVFLAALVILQHLRRRKQVKKKGSLEMKNRKFSYFDILKITNNFERVLGKGGFGTVYHGYLDDKQVAVKMLSPSSVQGYKQFQAEVELLMRAHHKNLTILVGYCDEGTNMGLIYEFMANGNLQAHLLAAEDKADILSWEGRLQIATESAQGLEYLHNGCKPPIVHRDVKSANILLNEKFQAKLADFGLSRIFPVEGGTHVSTTVVGTPGYLDPEYYISNRLTEKSDVYSFGVVLLELITGQPVFQKTPERIHIGQWVSSVLARGDIKNIVDQRLQGDFDTNTVWKAVEIAMACIHSISTRRPTMNQVVIELNDCLAMEIARTKAHETARDGTPDELMIDLNLQSAVFPLAR